jgi:hypothetical protein
LAKKCLEDGLPKATQRIGQPTKATKEAGAPAHAFFPPFTSCMIFVFFGSLVFWAQIPHSWSFRPRYGNIRIFASLPSFLNFFSCLATFWFPRLLLVEKAFVHGCYH